MPPPPLPVNGVRPKMEERRVPQCLVGKGIIPWIDKIPAQIQIQIHTSLMWTLPLYKLSLDLFTEVQRVNCKSCPGPLDRV